MPERTLAGIAAASGVAVGPAFCYQPVKLEVPTRAAGPADEELERFHTACDQASRELENIKAAVADRADDAAAAIFDAHLMMVADPMLLDAVKARCEAGQIVEAAVVESTEELAAMLGAMEDELFAARAVDMRDAGRRILRILLNVADTASDEMPQPSIVVAHDLTPSDTVRFRPQMILAFCTAAGGLTSHTAILARTLGIPAVVGLGKSIEAIEDGSLLLIDGGSGSVIVEPSVGTQEQYRQVGEARAARMQIIKATASREARTANGRRVEVGANIGDVDSARDAIRLGADGVGLLRTEFLYLQETQPPSEDRQIKAYRRIFEAMGGKPVIVRTLDIGGDKPPPYLKFDVEMNPFLGWRAIRICLDDIPLFKTQLRAILRAAVGHRALIMYPMISAVDELRAANAVLAEVRRDLDSEGLEYAHEVPVGIMVETPAAALIADTLASECDFLSIGTNDLTQYTLAADRTNERVAKLYQPLHPAVLRLIKLTIDASHRHGKWTGMCGELAGMPQAIPILLGMGLDEFSMVPSAIPEAKWLISQITDQAAHHIAAQALTRATAAEIEAMLAAELAELDTPTATQASQRGQP